MDLISRIQAALKPLNLDDLHLDLERTPEGRVGGVVRSPSFHGLRQTTRQDMIWTALESTLSREDLASILGLITLTPAELEDAA